MIERYIHIAYDIHVYRIINVYSKLTLAQRINRDIWRVRNINNDNVNNEN